MEKPVKEADGKRYSARSAEWRECFLRAKNEEIVAILMDESTTPTARFWDAKQRMKEIAKILIDSFDPHSRSNMFRHLVEMRLHGTITDADLNDFSEELRGQVLKVSRTLGE